MTIDQYGDKNTRSLLHQPSIFVSLKNNIQNQNHIFSIEFECLTEVTVYEGNFKQFKKIAANRIDLIKLYTSALEVNMLYLIEKNAMNSHLNATERYLCLKKEIPNIENLIQLNQIANYLNITPIQFSRIRKKIYS